MRNVLLTLGLAMPLLVSCGSSKKKNEESEPKSVETTEQKAPPPEASKTPGERPPHQLCRIDETTTKEYCFDRRTEFPSDTDPEKVVKKCESGFFGQDDCRLMKISTIEKGAISISIGTEQRLRGTKDAFELTRMMLTEREYPTKAPDSLDEKRQNITQLKSGKYLAYDYPTNYDKSVLNTLEHAQIRVSDNDIEVYQDGEQNPIVFAHYGNYFETGPVAFGEFHELCNSLDRYPHKYRPFAIFDWDVDGGHQYVCTNISTTRIVMNCDAKGFNCNITNVWLDWSDR